MKKIILTQGYSAIVDDDDFRWLSQWSWNACNWRKAGCKDQIYAGRTDTRTRLTVRMHVEIAKAHGIWIRGRQIDHIDQDRLNNRSDNLRAATRSQNAQNRSKRQGCTSRFKGVSWKKSLGKWQAAVHSNGKSIYLGVFETEIDAAKAYDAAALGLFGEFAALNQSKGEK